MGTCTEAKRQTCWLAPVGSNGVLGPVRTVFGLQDPYLSAELLSSVLPRAVSPHRRSAVSYKSSRSEAEVTPTHTPACVLGSRVGSMLHPFAEKGPVQ